jgi:hypothetical protein
MSTPQNILDDAELAKDYILRSTMSNEYKRVYTRLINISTLATNGITPEEKIQKMTECIQLLAITQGMYLSNIDQKIDKAIENANISQCHNCKAMKHANDVEDEQNKKDLINEYLKSSNITITDGINNIGNTNTSTNITKASDMSWQSILKELLLKPYIYVVLCLISVSPHGVDIIKTILHFFDK